MVVENEMGNWETKIEFVIVLVNAVVLYDGTM